MKTVWEGDKILLQRTPEERAPLLQRLSKIEGQVRGLSQMIAKDRYCGDELRLATAILAAMREVMRQLALQHVGVALQAGIEHPERLEIAMQDISSVLKPLLAG
jgi:DNA-binding FrmR family transcriptional regulator